MDRGQVGSLKIGIVGGTGDIGEGMARRLSSHYDVVLGSREAEKAHITSECTIDLLKQRGLKSRLYRGLKSGGGQCSRCDHPRSPISAP